MYDPYPCQGCAKRQVGCHACCKEYNDAKKAVDERNKKIREAKLSNEQFLGYHKYMKDKVRKKEMRHVRWTA